MTPYPRVAIVGASVRAAAHSLARAGCQVVAADLFADADLARTCPVTRIVDYPEGLVQWLAATECDGWIYAGALENHPELIDRMAQVRTLWANNGDVLRRVRNLLLLQEALGGTDCKFPETKACDGLHPGPGRWLHKTGQGGNGSGVSRATGQSPTTGYWQRQVTGLPGSAQYVADGDRDCRLLGITRLLVGETWAGAADFQYCGTLAPWALPAHFDAQLTQAGRILASQFGLRGLFGVDFIFDENQVWIIEINPRVTAATEVVERTTGDNALAGHLGMFGITIPQVSTLRATAAGKVVLYARRAITISPDESARLLAQSPLTAPARFADIPPPGTLIQPGEPVLSVLAEGNDIDAVAAELRLRVAALEHCLYRDGRGAQPCASE